MGKTATPGVEPALAFLVGATLAWNATLAVSSGGSLVALAALLVGVGFAWGRRPGRALAWVAVGALLVWARPAAAAGCLKALDVERPVTIVGNPGSDWKPHEAGWRSELWAQRVRQAGTVLRCHTRVSVIARGAVRPVSAPQIRVKGYLQRTLPLWNGPEGRSGGSARSKRSRISIKSPRFVRAASEGSVALSEASKVFPGVAGLGRRLRASVDESFSGVERRMGVQAARALLLGEKAALDRGLVRSLRRFGLSHLFAVSGLHVALLALLVHWLLRGFPSRPRLVMTTLAVLAYLVLVGARPSIVRATAMSVLAFGAVWSRRPPHPRQALSLAACGLIALDPGLIADLGFRLTVSATAGILWVSPVLENRWRSLPRPLRRPLAATVGAQLASLPFTVSTFSVLYPMAPLMNLVAIPWMAAFATLSMGATVLMKVVPETRNLAADVLDLGIAPIVWLEALPASAWFVFPVSAGALEASLLAACLAAILIVKGAIPRMCSILTAALLLQGPALPDVGEMIAIDVGQGDAFVLHDGHEAILIDGGGWRTADIGSSVLVPTLASLGIRRLRAVIVTHPDVDHCRGVLDLSYYLPIGRVLTAPGASASPCVRELVARPGTRWRELWLGQSLRVGRIRIETLHPMAGGTGWSNDSSLVLRLVLGHRSVLLSGDIEGRSERALLARSSSDGLRSDVLKLAHHGSKTSTTERFLRAVAPRVAVVSAGRRNHYGHPAAEVLERCRRNGIRVLRTDRDGMVRLPLEPNRRNRR